MIQAAGVVLVRETNPAKFLIIHRPHRNDWSLPKGKLEKGELAAIAAVRETAEETGYNVALENSLTPVEYIVGNLAKRVFYWRAHEIAEDLAVVPNAEVDQLKWVTLDEAKSLLTYPHDLAVAIEALAIKTFKTIMVTRHAISTLRENFSGNDLDRPLATAGFAQLNLVAQVLQAYGVTDVVSSPALRCQQTVSEIAHQLDLPYRTSEALLEEFENFDLSSWQDLIQSAKVTVICSHRPVIEQIADFVPDAAGILADLPPAGIVVLGWDEKGELINAERLEI